MGAHYGLVLMNFFEPGRFGLRQTNLQRPGQKLVEALTTLRAYQVEVSVLEQRRSVIQPKLGRNETRTIEGNSIPKQCFGLSNFEEAERVSKAMGE